MITLKPWRKGRSCMFCSSKFVDEEQVVVNDRVVKKSVVKTFVPSENFAGLKASDFALENVMAAGAVDMLKPTVTPDNSLDNVDRFENSVDNLIAAIDNSMPKNNVEE